MADGVQLLIKLGVENSSATKQIKELTSELKTLDKEIKGLDTNSNNFNKNMQNMGTKVDLCKTKVQGLNEKIEVYSKRLQEAEDRVKRAKDGLDALGERTSENAKEWDKANKELENAQIHYNNMNRKLAETQTELQLTNKQLLEFQKEMARMPFDNLATKLDGVGNGFKNLSSATAPLSLALGGIFGTAIATATNFEEKMAEVGAITNATSDDLGRLSEKAREIGSNTQLSASQGAEALKLLAQAGYDVDKSIATVDSTVNLAIASNMELAETTGILTSIMSAFGSKAEEATHITDILATTASNSNTDVSQLGEAFKNVAPTASALGYEIEDVSIVLGMMANNAIQGGEAGNALKSILASLAKPTKNAQAIMDEYGLSLTRANGEAKPFLEVVGDMRKAFGNLDEVQQTQIATTMVGKQQMSKFLAIINGSDEGFTQLTTAIENCDGATAKMKETMEDTTAGSIKALKSKLEEMSIQIGEKLLPHLVSIVEIIGDCVDWFNNLDDGTQDLIIRMGLFGVALSPISGLIGNIFSASSSLATKLGDLAVKGVEATDGMQKLQGGFGNVLKGIGGTGSGLIGGLASLATALAPFLVGGTVVVGVGLGLAGLVTAFQNMNQKAEEASRGFDINTRLMQEGSELLTKKINSNLDEISSKIDTFKTEGVTELRNAFVNIANDAEPNFESFKSMISQQLADTKSKINSDTNEMVNSLATFNDNASGKVVFTMESLKNLSDIHSENMFSGVENAYNTLITNIDNQGDVIKGIMEQQGVDYATAYNIWEQQVLSDYGVFCNEMMSAQLGYQTESINALEEHLKTQSITNQETLTQANTAIREGLERNNEVARQAYDERAIAVAQADQEWLDQTGRTREELYKINDLMYQEQQLINKLKANEENRTANEIAYIRGIKNQDEYEKTKIHYDQMEKINQDKLDAITTMIKNASEDNTTTWEQAYDAMVKATEDGYSDSVVYTQDFWNKLNQYFSKGGTDINEAINYAMDGMETKIETSTNQAVQDAQNMQKNFEGAMGGIKVSSNDMSTNVGKSTNKVSDDFKRMDDRIKDRRNSILSQNKDIAKSVDDLPNGKTIEIKSTADTRGITTMKNSLENLWGTARNAVSAVGQAISGVVGRRNMPSSDVGNGFSDMYNPNDVYGVTSRGYEPSVIATVADEGVSAYATRDTIASTMVMNSVNNYNASSMRTAMNNTKSSNNEMIELLKQMVNNQTPNITFEIHDNKISSEDDIYRLTEEIMKQMDFILNVKNRRY